MLGVFSTILLGFAPSYAFAVGATCVAGFTWTYNSLGQSPCDIASGLRSVCFPGADSTVPQLPPGYWYSGPTVDSNNGCTCSSVYYSMLSACAVCQTRDTLRWSAYATNCTTIYQQTFPDPIPPGLRVPHYAYLDVVTIGGFDPGLAQAAGGTESLSIPPATTVSPVTSPTVPIQISPKKSDAGAIAGGVVGGLVVLGIAAGVVAWLLRGRGRASPVSGNNTLPPQSPRSFASSVKTNLQHQIYNPSAFPTSQTPPGALFQSSQPFITNNYPGNAVPEV